MSSSGNNNNEGASNSGLNDASAQGRLDEPTLQRAQRRALEEVVLPCAVAMLPTSPVLERRLVADVALPA
jgi:hypothetical protein